MGAPLIHELLADEENKGVHEDMMTAVEQVGGVAPSSHWPVLLLPVRVPREARVAPERAQREERAARLVGVRGHLRVHPPLLQGAARV